MTDHDLIPNPLGARTSPGHKHLCPCSSRPLFPPIPSNAVFFFFPILSHFTLGPSMYWTSRLHTARSCVCSQRAPFSFTSSLILSVRRCFGLPSSSSPVLPNQLNLFLYFSSYFSHFHHPFDSFISHLIQLCYSAHPPQHSRFRHSSLPLRFPLTRSVATTSFPSESLRRFRATKKLPFSLFEMPRVFTPPIQVVCVCGAI